MKKINLILTLVLIFYTPFLAIANSKISISVSRPVGLKVIIDGVKFYSEDNYITIGNITPGNHHIKIFYARYMNGDQEENNLFNESGNIFWNVILNSSYSIRNNYYYDFVIPRSGKIFIDKSLIERDENEEDNLSNETDFNSGYENNYRDENFFSKGYKKNGEINEQGKSDQEQTKSFIEQDPNQGGNLNRNENKLISTSSYNQLKSMVKNEMVESNKLMLIKDASQSSWVTVQQAIELGNLFFSESNKVDYAKYIYSRVSDKKNFFLIYDIFQSTFSKEEVSEYVNKHVND